MENSIFGASTNARSTTNEDDTFRATPQDLYNDLGKTYEDVYVANEGQAKSLHWLIEKLPPGATVLDMGCGTGRPASQTLSHAGLAVTGVDISPVMLSLARASVPRATFIEADIRSFEPASGSESLDAIVAYFSLIGHITQDEIREFICKTHRLLKPGGYFVWATVPLEGDHLMMSFMGRDIYSSSFSTTNAVSEVQAAGFEVLEYEEAMFVPPGNMAGLGEPHLFIFARRGVD